MCAGYQWKKKRGRGGIFEFFPSTFLKIVSLLPLDYNVSEDAGMNPGPNPNTAAAVRRSIIRLDLISIFISKVVRVL